MSITEETLSAEAIDRLAATVRGRVVRPGDDDYDTARAVWNGLIDRRPAVIVQCSGAADVVDAVNFAREEGLVVSIRGGAHNVAGNAVNDGGIVIDLSQMRGVYVEPVSRTAIVQAGATWGDLDRETQLHGLAVPGGVVSTTGVAGPDAARRHGPPAPQARPLDRQPDLGRRGHGRRQAAPRERERERRSLLGDPRRRQQLRRRHVVRVRRAPGGADGLRGRALLPARAGARDPRGVARLHGRRRPTRSRRSPSAGASRPARRSPRRSTGKDALVIAAVHCGTPEQGEPFSSRCASCRAADRPERPVAVGRAAVGLRRAVPVRRPALLEVALAGRVDRRGDRHDRRLRRNAGRRSHRHRHLAPGRRDGAHRRGRHGLRGPRRRLPRHARGELDRPRADGRGDRLGPRRLGRARPVLDRRRVPQLPRRRRGSRRPRRAPATAGTTSGWPSSRRSTTRTTCSG